MYVAVYYIPISHFTQQCEYIGYRKTGDVPILQINFNLIKKFDSQKHPTVQ